MKMINATPFTWSIPVAVLHASEWPEAGDFFSLE
jgi:hypothetical protein